MSVLIGHCPGGGRADCQECQPHFHSEANAKSEAEAIARVLWADRYQEKPCASIT